MGNEMISKVMEGDGPGMILVGLGLFFVFYLCMVESKPKKSAKEEKVSNFGFTLIAIFLGIFFMVFAKEIFR